MSTNATDKKDHLLMRIAGARVGTEVLSRTGGSWLFRHVPSDKLSQVLATHVVEPRLEQCEQLLDQFLPGVETAEDRKERAGMSREERVNRIAREISRQGVEAAGNFVIQLFGQQAFDWVAGVPELGTKGQFKVVVADRAAQIGSVVLLNSVGTQANVAAQKMVSKLLMNHFGTPEDKAGDVAVRLLNDSIPSTLGMMASVLAHHRFSSK